MTESEVAEVVDELVATHQIEHLPISLEAITHAIEAEALEHATDEDVTRVRQRLSEGGWPIAPDGLMQVVEASASDASEAPDRQ